MATFWYLFQISFQLQFQIHSKHGSHPATYTDLKFQDTVQICSKHGCHSVTHLEFILNPERLRRQIPSCFSTYNSSSWCSRQNEDSHSQSGIQPKTPELLPDKNKLYPKSRVLLSDRIATFQQYGYSPQNYYPPSRMKTLILNSSQSIQIFPSEDLLKTWIPSRLTYNPSSWFPQQRSQGFSFSTIKGFSIPCSSQGITFPGSS